MWERFSSGKSKRRQQAWHSVDSVAAESLETRNLLSAVVVQLAASQDNTIYNVPAGDLSNGQGAFVVSGGSYGTAAARRGLLAFDISAANIPSGSTIVDVVLTMNLSRSVGGSAAVGVHRLLKSWGEGQSDAAGNEFEGAAGAAQDATWLFSRFDSLAWAAPGGDFGGASATVTARALGAYEWAGGSLIDDVQSWLESPAANFGWMLKSSELAGNIKAFVSRDSANAALRPRLEITYEEPVVQGIVEGRKWHDKNANGVRESPALLRLNLQFVNGNSRFNAYGGKEYWYQAAGTKTWYFLTPNGALTQWNGQAGKLTGKVVERLDARVWFTPETLLGSSVKADEPWMDGFSFELVNGAGKVVASAVSRSIDRNGDGVIQPEAERGWYRFENVQPGRYTVREVLPKGWLQSASATSPGAADAFRLDVSLGLTLPEGGVQENFGGSGERWLRGTAGWYYITPLGELYQWNGRAVTKTNSLSGTWIASPGVSYFRDVSLLHSAKNPLLNVKAGSVLTRVDFGNFKPTLLSGQTATSDLPVWIRTSRQFLASLASPTSGSGSAAAAYYSWQMIVVHVGSNQQVIIVDGVRDPIGTTDVWEQTTGNTLATTRTTQSTSSLSSTTSGSSLLNKAVTNSIDNLFSSLTIF